MPDLRDNGLDRRLVPPGVADERGRAFMGLIARALADRDPNRLRLTDYSKVDARLLPALVRQFSLQEFMFDGVTEEMVRDFLSNAVPLHQQKGTVPGIRFGLSLIGMRLEFRDWADQDPQGPPNTYTARAFVDDALWQSGSTLAPRVRSAARRMVNSMKRWSQEGSLTFGMSAQATMRIGAHGRIGGIVRTRVLAQGNQQEPASIGMFAVSQAGGRLHTTGLAA